MKSAKRQPKEIRELVSWIRKKDALQKLPVDHTDLAHLPIGDLRTLASMFKSFDGEAMRSCDRNELISFIAGHQHSPEQYIPLGSIPSGSLITFEGD